MAEWLRRLTRKPKVRTAVGSNPTLDSLVAVRNTSLGRPEPCEGNLVAVVGSCGGLMEKHPMAPAGNKSLRLSLASHVKYKYLPTYLPMVQGMEKCSGKCSRIETLMKIDISERAIFFSG